MNHDEDGDKIMIMIHIKWLGEVLKSRREKKITIEVTAVCLDITYVAVEGNTTADCSFCFLEVNLSFHGKKNNALK